MPHGHFSTDKRRIKKLWEETEKNSNDNKNLSKSIVSFESINHDKKNVRIPLITNKIFDSSTDFFFEATFPNFPEEFINYFKPMAIWSVGDAYNLDNVLTQEQFNQNIADETAKVGDIFYTSQFDYWYNNVDTVNLSLRIHYRIFVRELTSYTPGGGFSTSVIPTTMNIFMQGVNEKIYENINVQSE